MLILVLLALVGLAAFLVLHTANRNAGKRLRQVQEQSFAHLRFPAYGARLTGAEVTVVKRGNRPPEVPSLPTLDDTADASWWYCVGPRRTCYMAIAQCERQWLSWKVRWVVRPLDEEHMRQALDGDDDALWQAFGWGVGAAGPA